MNSVSDPSEFHVSCHGDDCNPGTSSQPLRTIQHAANLAQPGDTVTVHSGIYRERINPPRGGDSDSSRITYRAAEGESVTISGSEIVEGWEHVNGCLWKIVLLNSFFGNHNPFAVKVAGDWYHPVGNPNFIYHTGNVFLNGHWLTEAPSKELVMEQPEGSRKWFAEVTESQTTIYAQFGKVDPNSETVEVTVREAVFYPEQPLINYLTVRGFTMEKAAPNWAPPTCEQIALIGTHWSKGWIIEENTIRYATCSGVSLGKYGDEWDNKSESAEGYVATIKRALARGWSKEHIGTHIVRRNKISNCEQAGIVGSMGGIFSEISENSVSDINQRGLFAGEEMAGIKLHGAIDTVITKNHIYNCGGFGGIWLDWMTQGTRVTRNLLHDNSAQDLFVEVNHGPFLVDNNLFLSPVNMLEASGGGAYVHNLFAGKITLRKEPDRLTPYHPPHSTELAGLAKVIGDDERFINNIFAGSETLSVYDDWSPTRLIAEGNTSFSAPTPNAREQGLQADLPPQLFFSISHERNSWWLTFDGDPAHLPLSTRQMVSTDSLGKAAVPGLPYEDPKGRPYLIEHDYFGQRRQPDRVIPGPFCRNGKGRICVWDAPA